MKIINIVKKIFSEMSDADFCGCYEGDLDQQYTRGVDDFCKRLASHIAQQSANGTLPDSTAPKLPSRDEAYLAMPQGRGIDNTYRSGAEDMYDYLIDLLGNFR